MIKSSRVCIGPAGPVPCLAEATMDLLVGGLATPRQFSEAAEVALRELSLRNSKYRASREYRKEMIRSHLPRVLALAAERAVTGRVVPWGEQS